MRELPNAHLYLDGGIEALSKQGTFVGQHICVSREGAALQINAFNFPVWGMLEKFAPALLAGVPSVVKPASATAYLTQLVVRRIIESNILPEGSLQLICGGIGNLFDLLDCQDMVSFTGSAATAARLRVHPTLCCGDRFPQFLHFGWGRRAGQRGVRLVREGSGA
jgi:oxepin-CoA hydrolase/3-oxo-5,6-dehydrosuberyl-CoA semialdehyde dehydrogenase